MLKKTEFELSKNINDLVIADRDSYKVVLSTIDFESGTLKILVQNDSDKVMVFSKGAVSVGDNVILAKNNHDSTKIEEEIDCTPKANTEIDVVVSQLSERINAAIIFSFSIKTQAKEYYRYELKAAIDFDFDNIDLEVDDILGADLSSVSVPRVDFSDSGDSTFLDQNINQLVRTANDKTILKNALDRRNGGEEYNLEKMGLFYKYHNDYPNYVYSMQQLVNKNNRLGLAELAELYLAPNKEERDKKDGYNYACKLEKLGDAVGTFWKGYAQLNGLGVKKSITDGISTLQKFIDNSHEGGEKVLVSKLLLSNVYVDYYPFDIKRLETARTYREELNRDIKDISVLIDEVKKKNRARKQKVFFTLALLVLLFTVGKYFNNSLPAIDLHDANQAAHDNLNIDSTGEYELVEDFDTSGLETIPVKNISASSELIGTSGKAYSADYIIDNDIQTSWQEGEDGDGSGSTIDFDFDGKKKVGVIELYIGKQVSKEDYEKNNRPKKITFQFDKDKVEVELSDYYGSQSIVFSEQITTRKAKVIIDEVYQGTKYNDTNIGEIRFWGE